MKKKEEENINKKLCNKNRKHLLCDAMSPEVKEKCICINIRYY